MQNALAINTWFRDETEEEGMFDDHAYLWRHLIGTVRENDFQQSTVLDYGCNRGGFLDVLFGIRPYHHGIGVDIAETSLSRARERCRHLSVDFMLPAQMQKLAQTVDIAFSHEVLYLLQDLQAHAKAIANILKPDGVYYAAIGCHTDNPLWARWRTLIGQSTNIPVFDYSLDDYANAFWRAGFRVEMRPFGMTDLVLMKPHNAYFPSVADSLRYHAEIKTIIRASRI
jgi:SAM-dependent methyltransferase